MSQLFKPTDLGPLPKADDASALQRRSLAALNATLPVDQFVLRDERTEDFGVDLSLEVLLDGVATNFRSQVQLKARSGTTENADGSVSIQVDVSNMNYVLNGPSPLYILYRPEAQELRTVWAQDEAQRLQSAGKAWREQQTIAIRFPVPLTPSQLEAIGRRIVNEGTRKRKTNDILAAVTPLAGRQVKLEFSESSVLDRAGALRMLEEQGLALVAFGRANRVMELASLLDEDDQLEPRVALVLAYAAYTRGKYGTALAHLADAEDINDSHLDATRDYLTDSCLFYSGKIDRATYRQRLRRLRDRVGEDFRVQFDMAELRGKYLSEFDHSRRQRMREKLLSFARMAVKNESIHPLVNATAQRYVLEVEADQLNQRILHALVFGRQSEQVLRLIFRGKSLDMVLEEILNEILKWEEAIEQLIRYAASISNTPLELALRYLHHLSRHALAVSLKHAAAISRTSVSGYLEALGEPTLEALEGLQARARREKETETELRVQMLYALVLDASGQQDDARGVARKVMRRADLYQMADVFELASDLASGESHHRRTVREIDTNLTTPTDELVLSLGAEEVAELARTLCVTLNLPDDRAACLEDEIRAVQEKARVQRRVCQHLEHLQKMGHLPPHLNYSEVPLKKARCNLYGYSTGVPHKDVVAVYSAFTATYCQWCRDRAPLPSRRR